MSVPASHGVVRRYLLALLIGAAGALAIGGAALAVRERLHAVHSQPPRQAVSTKPVAPPPIALPLVLQSIAPVPSTGAPTGTTQTQTQTQTQTTTAPPPRGGPAHAKPARTPSRAGKRTRSRG